MNRIFKRILAGSKDKLDFDLSDFKFSDDDGGNDSKGDAADVDMDDVDDTDDADGAKDKPKKNKPKGDYYWNTREMVEKNRRILKEKGIKKGKDKCRSFSFEKDDKTYQIFNPFKDETGKKNVDPKEYYGEAYEESDFNRVN